MRAWLVITVAGFLLISSAGWTISGEAISNGQPPVVVATVPPAGDAMVNPSLQEIKITFSKPMQINGWSLVMQDKVSFPKITGQVGFQNNDRTFIAPVRLEPGRKYVIWVNSGRYQNFRDQQGRPAVPYLLSFHTKP